MIDAHHHVWQLARGGYGWMTPDMTIHHDYGLDDLRPLLDGVGGTVLVQADATEAETDFMLEVAAGSAGLVLGVVGWVDLAAPDASARIATRASTPGLVGLRPMLQDLPDPRWILRPEVAPALAAMERLDLPLDLLILAHQLPLVPELAARHPALRMVIDHGAKPPIREGSWQPWADDLALAAALGPRIHVKMSGLVTEAAPGWTTAVLRPWVAHLLDCFGPGRVLWGSDWPVVDLAGGYNAWREASLDMLDGLGAAEREAVLGGNAARFYRLGS
ncbi:amidohydrolase family protein [Pseudoroseomonas globiformis]|uniref:Amidohydrolase family protein n=1 Tax=Teichococcus globiformis TaxID=2307229 RepID=A0ABV7FTR0_9PROT